MGPVVHPERDGKRDLSHDSPSQSDGSGAPPSDSIRPRKRPKLPSPVSDPESSEDEWRPEPRVRRALAARLRSTRSRSFQTPYANATASPGPATGGRYQLRRPRGKKASYGARYRMAASRHFVHIPRPPAEEHLQALADSVGGYQSERQIDTGGEATEPEQNPDEDQGRRLPRHLSGNVGFKDYFHRAEVGMATEEAFHFNLLADQLDAQGALGPGPTSGRDNEHLRLANIFAAGDLLRRFPRAPPLASNEDHPSVRHMYRERYRSYAALYHRHASAAWPQPSTVQEGGPTLAEQVVGMADRRWRLGLQATFAAFPDGGLSSSESESSRPSSGLGAPSSASEGLSASSGYDSDSGSDSDSGPGSERSRQAARSPSLILSQDMSPRSSRSPKSPSSGASDSSGTASSFTSRSSSHSGHDSDSEVEETDGGFPPDQPHLSSLLEMVDPPAALTDPLVASIDSDLRKVYALMPLLVARRRQAGRVAHASHSLPNPTRFESAAQWGYEGPMLDWRDMLTLLQSPGTETSPSSSGHGEHRMDHSQLLLGSSSAWPAIVPDNDPRKNALLRTIDRLKGIYKPRDPEADPAAASPPPSTPNPDHEGNPSTSTPSASGQRQQSEEQKQHPSIEGEAAAAAHQVRAMRSDLFSLPPLPTDTMWSSLVAEAFIPV